METKLGSYYLATRAVEAMRSGLSGWDFLGGGCDREAYRHERSGLVAKVSTYDGSYEQAAVEDSLFKRLRAAKVPFVPPSTLYSVHGKLVTFMPYLPPNWRLYEDLSPRIKRALNAVSGDVSETNVGFDEDRRPFLIDGGITSGHDGERIEDEDITYALSIVRSIGKVW